MVLNAQRRITEQPPNRETQQAGGNEGQRIGHARLRHQRKRIGADADESALRYRNLPGIAQRQVETDRSDRQNRPHRNQKDAERLEKERRRDGDDGGNSDRDGAGAVHTVRSSTRPSSPCGRSRITAIRISSGNAAAILRGKVSGRQIVEDAENNAAEDGAAHLVEPADDGGQECRHAQCLAVGEFRQIDRADQDRRDGDQNGVDEKGVEHHPLHRDAENARQRRILRRRLHASGRAASY